MNADISSMARRVVLKATTPAVIPPGRSDTEEKSFSVWRATGSNPHVDIINKNIADKEDPFKDLTSEDKRELLAYVVYSRENASGKKEDNPNYESARDILDQHSTSLSDKDIDQNLVKQLTKFNASGLTKPLAMKGNKVVVEGED